MRGVFALCLMLAACGPRPLGDPMPLEPVRLERGVIAGAEGVTLALHEWRPAGRPRAVVLALHGYGDTAEGTYDAAARAWARRGILTYAYDQRGFGANPSRRQWPGAEALSTDAVAIAAALRARHPGVPLVAVGHSMGGGVVLAAAGEGLAADALVLAAPAIAGGDTLSPVQRAGGWALGAFAPDKRFTGDGVVDLLPSDNIEAMRAAGRNRWHFADPSGRELWGLVRVSDRAAKAAPRVAQPTLTLMGRNDGYIRPAAVQEVHGRIPGGHRYILYDAGWHWLFRDLQAARVWADVGDFILSRKVPAAREK